MRPLAPRWISFAASSSRCTRWMRTPAELAAAGTAARRTGRSGSPSAGPDRSSSCGGRSSAARARSRAPGRSCSPKWIARSLTTGSEPGQAEADRAGVRVRRRRRSAARSRRTSSSRSPAGRGSRGRSPARARRCVALTTRAARAAVEAERALEREGRVEQRALAERRRRSSCRPTGSAGPPPGGSARPHGIEIAGIPASDIGTVQKSLRYIASGSSVFAPSSKATPGEVGVAIDVEARERRREVLGDLRAHALGLPVVGVVVAARERVGAEHDAALDLGAEAVVRACACTSRAGRSASGAR